MVLQLLRRLTHLTALCCDPVLIVPVRRVLVYNGRIIPFPQQVIPNKQRPLIVFDGDPRQEEHLALLSGYWRRWKKINLRYHQKIEREKKRLERERLKQRSTPPVLTLSDGSSVTLEDKKLMTQKTGETRLASSKDLEKRHVRDFTMTTVEELFSLENENPGQHIVDIPNPYGEDRTQCLFCKHNIIPSYKNPKLLSQFVSPVTGHIFDQSTSGLCKWQYEKLIGEIKRARYLYLMPLRCKHRQYLTDPEICDPMHPKYKIFG